MTRKAHAADAQPPAHVLLLEDCEPWRAGKVLPAGGDLLSKLDGAKVKYRAATKRECELHGIADETPIAS